MVFGGWFQHSKESFNLIPSQYAGIAAVLVESHGAGEKEWTGKAWLGKWISTDRSVRFILSCDNEVLWFPQWDG